MLTILAAAAVAAAEPARPECAHDHDAMLALDFAAFDQTEGTGWRPLYDARCFVEAAELLRAWRARHGDVNPILAWHEAQMWAFGGRDDRALPIFERTYRQGDDSSTAAWNLYVDGTLAFLRRDRPALEAAIDKLAPIPAPPNWGAAVGVDGKPLALPWPLNLDVLQGLLRCWEQPYAVAYVCRDIPRRR